MGHPALNLDPKIKIRGGLDPDSVIFCPLPIITILKVTKVHGSGPALFKMIMIITLVISKIDLDKTFQMRQVDGNEDV